MKKLLFAGTENTVKTDFWLALFRLYIGLSLAFAHGLGKMPPSAGFIEHTADLGFPWPGLFAWVAGLSEFAGGLLLAIGLFTRPAAFFVAATLFVAGFVNHANDPYGMAEKAFMYLAAAVLFLVLGSGRFSVDNRVRQALNI